MYRGHITETKIQGSKEEVSMERRINLWLVKVVTVFLLILVAISATKEVQAGTYSRYFQDDLETADITKHDIQHMLDEIKGTYHNPDTVYEYDSDFAVIFVLTAEGHETYMDYLEQREMPVIVIQWGITENPEGDGHCTDGSYIGYRLDGNPIFPAEHWIRTIEVHPGNDRYTDTIIYRSDRDMGAV